MQENLLSLSIQPFLNALNDDSITTRSSLSDDLEQFFIQELPPSTIQPIRLAGSYRCWFVKKYCWLVCVRKNTVSAENLQSFTTSHSQTNRLLVHNLPIRVFLGDALIL